jgi:hypothetical protein
VYTAWWWADIFLWTEKSVKIFASDYYIVKEQYIKSSMCYNLLCFENHVPSTLKTVTLYVEAQNTFKTNIFHLSKLIILVKPMAVSHKKGEIYFNLACNDSITSWACNYFSINYNIPNQARKGICIQYHENYWGGGGGLMQIVNFWC